MTKSKFSCRTVSYTVIGLALTCIAIWDAHNIIRDFVTDNRLTVVKVVNITDKYPFIGRARFCITYLIPPFSWLDTSMAYSEASHKQEQAWSRRSATDKCLDVDDVFIALLLYQYMRDIDKAANTEIFTQKQLQILNMTKPEAMTLMDSFVTSSRSIDLLTDIWRDLRPIMAQRATTNQPLFDFMNAKITLDEVEFELDPFRYSNKVAGNERTKFCFFLPIREELSVGGPDVTYNVDLLPVEQANLSQTGIQVSSMLTLSSTYRLQINDQMVQLSETKHSQATISSVQVIISNSGTFDTSAFPPCSAQFGNEADCLAEVRRRAVQEVCQCTQFTEEMKAAFERVAEMRTTARNSSRRPCTTRLYEECLVQAIKVADAKAKEAQAEKACTPCHRSMNTFQVVESEESSVMFAMGPMFDGKGSNAGSITELGTNGLTRWTKITFSSPDTVYIAFQDKQQFDLSQLIAQVGGNVGLYTGFSMLTIVELILFFHKAYQSRHSKQSDEKTESQMTERIDKLWQTQQKIVVDIEQLQVNQRKLGDQVESMGVKIEALLGRYQNIGQRNRIYY